MLHSEAKSVLHRSKVLAKSVPPRRVTVLKEIGRDETGAECLRSVSPLRVSRRSNAQSSYTQTQRSSSALARHITLDASTRVAVATQKAACSICTCMASSSSLRRCVLFRALSEDSSGSGGALSPLLPQQAQSESPSSTIPFLCINTRRWVTGRKLATTVPMVGLL